MQRVVDAVAELRWLDGLSWLDGQLDDGAVTGYDPGGWAVSTWILHAMYHNSELDGLGSHDDHHKARLRRGEISPFTVAGINVDERSTFTGRLVGFTQRPSAPWQRLLWRDHLASSWRFPPPDVEAPPCSRWFPHSSWPLNIKPPPEGSLEEASLDALVAVLAEHSSHGRDTACLAFYCALATADVDAPHVWEGPLGAVGELINERGGTYPSSPTNFWPRDRSWFVWTDWDLLGTKVSGTDALVQAITESSEIETVNWPIVAQ